MTDWKRKEEESLHAWERRMAKEREIETRLEWCKLKGKDCISCGEISCERNSEYGIYHNKVVN